MIWLKNTKKVRRLSNHENDRVITNCMKSFNEIMNDEEWSDEADEEMH